MAEDKDTKLEIAVKPVATKRPYSNRKDNNNKNTGSRKAFLLCFGPASTKKHSAKSQQSSIYFLMALF